MKPFVKFLRKGSPFAFQVLSDRAFGKLKETRAIERSPYQGVSDEDLRKRIEELEAKALEMAYVRVESKTQPRADDRKLQ